MELGRYVVLEQIGAGGMGRVFRAHDPKLRREVALKLLAPALSHDDSFRERFDRESRRAAEIDHPNIIPIYDAGEADGQLYIAMRYVNGSDLKTLIETDGPLGVGRTLFIQRDAIGVTDMIVWTARKPFLDKNRAAMVDFMEDVLRITRWFLDPRNHKEVTRIAGRITRQPPERYDWLFTERDTYHDAGMLPDLPALQNAGAAVGATRHARPRTPHRWPREAGRHRQHLLRSGEPRPHGAHARGEGPARGAGDSPDDDQRSGHRRCPGGRLLEREHRWRVR